jgi:hypothetical protein
MIGRGGHYFVFVPAACLLAMAAFFCAAMASFLDFFWSIFFWFAFGDLSPIIFLFLFLWLICPRNKDFSASNFIMLPVALNANKNWHGAGRLTPRRRC